MKPCWALVGASGVGKTTALVLLKREFESRGLKVELVKHSHHPILGDEDPSRDGARLQATVVGRDGVRLRGPYDLSEVVEWVARGNCDLILIEGGKGSEFPKIELLDRSRGFDQPLVEPARLRATIGDVEVAGVRRLDYDPALWADFMWAPPGSSP